MALVESLHATKDLAFLLESMGLFPRYLMSVTIVCTVAVAVVFFMTYSKLLKPRVEGKASKFDLSLCSGRLVV